VRLALREVSVGMKEVSWLWVAGDDAVGINSVTCGGTD
jgi:hypothetical protein